MGNSSLYVNMTRKISSNLYILNSNTSNQSFVLEIKNYQTLLIEKKLVIRKPELEMLKFPQLMVAYYFDYSRYIIENKILYSVLSSSETKLEVPTNQIKVDYKKMKPSAKKRLLYIRKQNLKIW